MGHEVVVMLLLIVEGIDVNTKSSDGRTPFAYAATKGHEDILKLLSTIKGVDVKAKKINGQAELFWAISMEQESEVNLILVGLMLIIRTLIARHHSLRQHRWGTKL